MLPYFLTMGLSGRDYIEREITPSEEDCTNAGEDLSQMYMEGNAIKAQLQRMFGTPPEDFNFCLTTCPHEFGTYMALRLEYVEGQDEPSMQYALQLDGQWPKYWDEQSRTELAAQGYKIKPQPIANSSKSTSKQTIWHSTLLNPTR